MTMSDTATQEPVPGGPPGLSDLGSIPLHSANQRLLDQLESEIVPTTAAWSRRKLFETRYLLALSQIADRVHIRHLNLQTEFCALIHLDGMPVACRAPGDSDVHLEYGAVLALQIPELILSRPLPGPSVVRILAPHFVHHPNVGPSDSPNPALCLGENIPRGFPFREIVIGAYAALTLQAISLDVMDTAGILNPEAVLFWQANTDRIPLSTQPFLGTTIASSSSDKGGRS